MKSFEEVYEGRPDKKGVGSSGYSNLKNLYNICERLKPWHIYESGTWKGNSSWLFWHFVGNELDCFDLDFSNRMWEHKDIIYGEYDIENITDQIQHEIYHNPDKALFFFDDHVSQLQRLEWLIKIGAKYAVFDDNMTSAEIEMYGIKNPPSPTLEQLKEEMMNHQDFHIFNRIKKYEPLPYHGGNRTGYDTRLTLIEL